MGSFIKNRLSLGIFCLLVFGENGFSREVSITSLDDDGAGSLRDAMLNAQEGDFLIFDPSLEGTITLGSNLPQIGSSYSIQGPGNEAIAIDGSSLYQIFTVDSGIATISHLQLINADPSPGGAIHLQADAALNLVDVSVAQNILGSDKMIQADSGSTLSLHNLTISNFSSDGIEHSLFASPDSLIVLNTDRDIETDLIFEGTSHVLKEGTGTFKLYTNTPEDVALTVQEGSLIFNGSTIRPIIVGKEGFLGGNFTCSSLVNEGAINPGNSIGISQSLGDYNQSGTLEIELSAAGECDQLQVGGNAFLDGSLVIIPEPGLYLKGESFTFLTTAGGIDGQFSSISSTMPGLNFSLLESAQSLQITILENTISPQEIEVTGNKLTTLNIFQNAPTNRNTDLFSVMSELSSLSPSELEFALDQLNADAFPSIFWSEATTLYQLANTASLPFSFCDYLCQGSNDLCCPSRESNRFWTKAIGEKTNQQRIDGLPGFFTYAGGFLTGYDQKIDELCTLGCYGAYTYSNFHWKDPSEHGNAHINGYDGSVYASICTKYFQMDVSVIGSFFQQNISRHIEFDDFYRTAQSSPNGKAVLGHLGAYGMFPVKSSFLSPFVRADYISIWQDKIQEKGANSVNLIVPATKWQFIHAEAGLYASGRFCFNWGAMVPSASLSWVLFGPVSGTSIKNKWQAIPGTATFHTSNHQFNGFSPTLELGFIIYDQAWLSAAYKGEFSSGRTEQDINLNFRWQF